MARENSSSILLIRFVSASSKMSYSHSVNSPSDGLFAKNVRRGHWDLVGLLRLRPHIQMKKRVLARRIAEKNSYFSSCRHSVTIKSPYFFFLCRLQDCRIDVVCVWFMILKIASASSLFVIVIQPHEIDPKCNRKAFRSFPSGEAEAVHSIRLQIIHISEQRKPLQNGRIFIACHINSSIKRRHFLVRPLFVQGGCFHVSRKTSYAKIRFVHCDP